MIGCFRYGGGLIGFIGGVTTRHIMNPEIKILNESFFWILESCRGTKTGGGAAILLLNAFVNIGKRECDWILFGLPIDKSGLRGRTLEKRGFVKKENSYLLEV